MEHPAYSQLRPVTPSAGVVLCPNPGYTTLEGTNSWVIRAHGDPRSIVIDPGPEEEGHLNVLNKLASEVALVLLTSRRGDYADSAQRIRQLTGAPVRAFSSRLCRGAEPLKDSEIIKLKGVTPQIEVVYAPGHTADSACFFIWSGKPGATTLEGIATGGTIAGRHTTMISESDGDLKAYLHTLKMLKKRGKGVHLLPGHGPDGDNVAVYAKKYIDRRKARLDQIQAALDELGSEATVRRIVDKVYTEVDPVLRHAAEQSTRVTLRYLGVQVPSK